MIDGSPRTTVPRGPRSDSPGETSHIVARGVDKRVIFRDSRDRRSFLTLLGSVVLEHGWQCLTYCLMGNHMHLLIETPQPNLGRGMQRLHGTYAQAFNRRHGKSGHVFGARFGSTSIVNDIQLWITVGYIACNPVEAGFCKLPEEWSWGSHKAISDSATPPWLDAPRLFDYFAQMGGDPRRRYLDFVAAHRIRPKGV
jgi:putative transposase